MKRKPVLMLDEIAAELDEKGRNIMVNTLAESSWQVFAATAEGNIRDWPGAVWAVEKGHVRKLD
jgi:DNA replication and repair protein RecF